MTEYTDYHGQPLSERDLAIVEQMKAKLMDGQYFRNVALSERSSYGYRPCTNSRGWAHIIETLGKMAGEGPKFAQLASDIVRNIPLYQTDPEMIAKVYEAAALSLAKGFDDVVGRSGPEGGRFKDHQHQYNLNVRILLAFWLAEATAVAQHSTLPGVGWCISTLAYAELGGGGPRRHSFPHLSTSLRPAS